jgi:hypothetical protein
LGGPGPVPGRRRKGPSADSFKPRGVPSRVPEGPEEGEEREEEDEEEVPRADWQWRTDLLYTFQFMHLYLHLTLCGTTHRLLRTASTPARFQEGPEEGEEREEEDEEEVPRADWQWRTDFAFDESAQVLRCAVPPVLRSSTPSNSCIFTCI